MAEKIGSTSSGLIRRAQAGDAASWRDLVDRYGPLVCICQRRYGVPRDDMPDLTQEVFAAVVKMLPDYQHKSFRGWLAILTRNKVADYFRRNGNQPTGRGGTSFTGFLHTISDVANEEEDEQAISGISREQVLKLADIVHNVRSKMEPRCWDAFWAVEIEERYRDDVAEELGMTLGTLYQAVSRTRQRLLKALAAGGFGLLE